MPRLTSEYSIKRASQAVATTAANRIITSAKTGMTLARQRTGGGGAVARRGRPRRERRDWRARR